MATLYPIQIDTSLSLPTVKDNITVFKGIYINQLRDAIISVEAALGTDPATIYGTVANRLANIESIINQDTGAAIHLGGDIAGTAFSPIVIGLQGRPVLPNQPDVGMVLTYNGSQWAPIFPDVLEKGFIVTLDGKRFLEFSEALINPIFSATYSNPVVTGHVQDNIGGPQQNIFATPSPGSPPVVPPDIFVYNQSYEYSVPTTVSFFLTANDSSITTVAPLKATWTQRLYYGAASPGGNSGSFIQSLANNPLTDNPLTSGAGFIFTINASTGQSIYFSYPTRYALGDFWVDGFEGGFNLISTTIAVTNAFGFTENYTLYQSAQVGLGITETSVFFNGTNKLTSLDVFNPDSGLGNLFGDTIGSIDSNTVVRIQGTPVSSASVANDGYALVSVGNVWTPTGVAPVFNVKNFGAKGDGTTDDTSAVQAAINTAGLGALGGTIHFPRGNYKITSTLTLLQGVRLQGERANYQNDPTPMRGTWLRWHGTNNTAMLLINNLQDISIERMAFHGNLSAGSSGITLVHLTSTNAPSSYNIFISECLFAEAAIGIQWGDGAPDYQSDHALIQHCYFVNMTNSGIIINSANAADDSRIDNCSFNQMTYGIQIQRTGFVSIRDSVGGGTPNTFIYIPNMVFVNNVLVENCQSENFTWFINAAGTNDSSQIVLISNTPDSPLNFNGNMNVIGIGNTFQKGIAVVTLTGAVRFQSFNDRFVNDCCVVSNPGCNYVAQLLNHSGYYGERESAGEIYWHGDLAQSVRGNTVGHIITGPKGNPGHNGQYWTAGIPVTDQEFIRPTIDDGYVFAVKNGTGGTTVGPEPTWNLVRGSETPDNNGTTIYVNEGPLSTQEPFGPLGHYVLNSDPRDGTHNAYYRLGNVVWNSNPNPGSPLFWTCTTAGYPGSWTASYSSAGIFNIQNFGAITNDTTDCTAFINSALTASTNLGTVFVPAGTYRVSGTIVIGTGQSMILDQSAKLHKHSSDSATPIIRMTGVSSKLTGKGTLKADLAIPKGILHIGPNSQSVSESIEFLTVNDVHLQGNQTSGFGDGSVGLYMDSSEPVSGGNNYQNNIIGLYIQAVDEGIHCDIDVNAHSFYGNMFLQIGNYAYHFISGSENTVYGGFTSGSHSALSIIKVENSAYDLFYGVQAEPGGSTCHYFDIDGYCTWIQVHGHNNCPSTGINAGLQSIITANGQGFVDTGSGTYYLGNGSLIIPSIDLEANQLLTIKEFGNTPVYVQLGPIGGTTGSSVGAVYLGNPAVTNNNFTLAGDDSSLTVINVPTSGTGYLRINNASPAAASWVTNGTNATLRLDGNFLYAGTGSPSSTNHLLYGDGTSLGLLNAPSGGTVALRINNTNQVSVTSSSVAITPSLLNFTGGTGDLQSNGTTIVEINANKLWAQKGWRQNVTSTSASTYNVLATDNIIATDSTSNTITVNLPTSPSIGDTYQVKDVKGAAAAHNNVTIDSGSGNKIDDSQTFIINTNYGSLTIVCISTSPSQWSIL